MKYIYGLLFYSVFCQQLSTQEAVQHTIEIGVRRLIQSAILNEERSIFVSLPRSYSHSSVNYPVIYVLDGGSLFHTAVAAAHFLAYNSMVGLIPEAIVVGIANTDRDRDMPVPQEFYRSQGPAQYLAFIAKELLPFIGSHYRVNGLNVLVGHSQGALFATYAGIEMPDQFKGVIALDAPMTVIPEVGRGIFGKLIRNSPWKYFSGEVLYGWGAEFGKLKDRSGFKQVKIENENHETMPYKGTYDGLRFLFAEHRSTDNVLSLKNLRTHYSKLSSEWACEYAIPASVLLHQALPMMIGRSKKKESLELVNYYERKYGKDQLSLNAMNKAESISSGPDDRVEYYLSLPSPLKETVTPFLGKWKGTVIVPGGMDTDIEWEITEENHRYTMVMNVMNSFILKNDFLLTGAKDSLYWGRKHQTGGLYLSSAKLSSDGSVLEGSEDLIGHHRAEGEPMFIRNRFRFVRMDRDPASKNKD